MRFELPEAKKLTLEMVIPIRWGDMDAMGHVNNTIYFRYLEIVRIEWLHQVAGAPDPAGEGPVIVNTFCNFLKQLKYLLQFPAPAEVPGRRAGEALRGQPGTDQLRGLRHARAHRRAGCALRDRRGEDGVGELPARMFSDAARKRKVARELKRQAGHQTLRLDALTRVSTVGRVFQEYERRMVRPLLG